MPMSQGATANLLLRALPAADYDRLAPHFRRIPLPVGLYLHHAARPIEKVYFPEAGLVSIVAMTLDGKSCEVGVFGREGMSETATVLGTDHSPHGAYVQAEGSSALMLPVAVLNAAMLDSPALQAHLLRYCQAMMIQLSSSIAAAGQTIHQRLARWLLMCHDRVEDDEVRLTHEFIGMMLNVRRAGVTEALHDFGTAGLISIARASIRVLDRDGLETLAAGGYGLAEAEYERLTGSVLRRPTVPVGAA